MAAKQTYEATFAIGAKLQGSFASGFAKAQAAFKKLGSAASKVFGTIGRGFQLALGGMAAFAAVNALKGIFTGAEGAAKAALDRTQRMTALLGSHPQMQKLATAAIKGQVGALQELSNQLGKVGVVHSDHYEAAANTLLLYGKSPAAIGKWLPVLGDALTATKGINASQEQMEKLTEGIGKAIKTGQVKALMDVGIQMDDNQKKKFKALKQTEREQFLITELTQMYKGQNEEAAKTDPGKIKQMQNMMASLSETVGLKMIPMQARMAEFWLKTIPAIEPIVLGVFDAIAGAFDLVGGWVKTHGPGIEKWFKDVWADPNTQSSIKDLGDAFNVMGEALKPIGDLLKAGWDELVKWAKETDWAAEFSKRIKLVSEDIKAFAGVIKGIGDAWNTVVTAFQTGDFSKVGEDLSKTGGDLLKSMGAEEDWQKISKLGTDAWQKISEVATDAWNAIQTAWAGVGAWFSEQWNQLTASHQVIFDALSKPFSDAWAAVQAAWNQVSSLFGGVVGQISSGLSGVTEALKKPFVDAITYIQKIWDDLVRAITSFDIGKVASDLAGKASKALDPRNWFKGKEAANNQRGGIVQSPTLSWLGEKGPEAVIPLRGEQTRAEGLLGAAAGALGLGAGRGGGGTGPTTLNFNPQVTVQGNAGESELRALDDKLRALARDFMSEYKAAQNQERRLAFG